MPQQVPRMEGKSIRKFKPTVPAHRPPHAVKSEAKGFTAFFFGGGKGVKSDGDSLNNGGRGIFIFQLYFLFFFRGSEETGSFMLRRKQ